MKCATAGARFVRVLLAGVAAAVVLSFAPTAQAGEFEDPNICVSQYDSSWSLKTVQYAKKGKLWECAPATSGLNPAYHRDLLYPTWSMLNNYFGSRSVDGNGPVGAAKSNGVANPAAAQQFARFVNQGQGPDFAAGYTPTETTNDWIQRHLQPARDHHVNGWFNTSWSDPRDRHNPTRYDSDVVTLTLGADMPILNDDLLFGIFGSFTNSDVDTAFNNGGVESKLGTVGPYFVYTLNEYVSFDTTVAAVFGQHENIVGAPGGGAGSSGPKARGEQDVDGFFVSLNANASYWVGNIGVQGRVGFVHSDMETESYDLASAGSSVRIPGANNELSQVSVATQFNYFYDQGLPFFEEVMAMPFARFTFNYDLDHDNIQLPCGGPIGACTISQHPNDDDEVHIAWGVTLFGNSAFSGSFEGGRSVARSKFEAWTVSGTLNYAF